MRKMKDSGIEWIGEIPEEWEINKIHTIYSERNSKVSDSDFPPLSVTKQGVVPQLETAAKTDNGDNRKLIKKNDFVINSRSDRRGSCGISEYDGSCSVINIVLKPRKNMFNLFYNFVFHTELFADEFYCHGNGIVDDLWSTKWSNMKNIIIPVPSINDQRHIAEYLDSRCSKIDGLVSDIEKQITTLEQYKRSVITEAVTKGLDPAVPMKDSGIEWIGEIPSHWGLEKLKYKTKVRSESGKFFPEDKYIGLENVESYTGSYLPTDTVYDEAVYDIYRQGDILFGKLRPYLAKVFITEDNGFCTGEFAVIKDYKGYLRFLFYYLLSDGFLKIVNASTYGAKMPRANWDFIKNLPVPTIPSDEERCIADYLDSKCSEIDSAISLKKQQIETLNDYKKSLIYEYVTGKKEIPA